MKMDVAYFQSVEGSMTSEDGKTSKFWKFRGHNT